MKKEFIIRMKFPGVEKKAPTNKDGEYIPRVRQGVKSFYDKTSKTLNISVEYDSDSYKRFYPIICDAFIKAYWYVRENKFAGNEPMMLSWISQAQAEFFDLISDSNAKAVLLHKEDLEIGYEENKSGTCKFICSIILKDDNEGNS